MPHPVLQLPEDRAPLVQNWFLCAPQRTIIEAATARKKEQMGSVYCTYQDGLPLIWHTAPCPGLGGAGGLYGTEGVGGGGARGGAGGGRGGGGGGGGGGGAMPQHAWVQQTDMGALPLVPHPLLQLPEGRAPLVQ